MRSQRQRIVLQIGIALTILYLQHFQLTYSTCVGIKAVLLLNTKCLLLNMLVLSILTVLLYVLIGKLFVALLTGSIVVLLLSVTNCYVTLFHGAPFFASDIYNIPTALNVLGEYRIGINTIVLRLICVSVLEAVLLILLYALTKKAEDKHRKPAVVFLLATLFILWIALISPWRFSQDPLKKWSWETSVHEYGYELCFVDSVRVLFNVYNIPDEYSADRIEIQEHRNAKIVTDEAKPDIILILNETLCDLSYYSNVKEGADVLAPIYQIPDIISGKAVVPMIGGGTNSSEYELLTSNSMAGLAVSSPFLVMNMNDVNSVVSYLRTLGYYSIAMHCGVKTNYARNTAYPALGFQEVYLGPECFTHRKYGNRPWYDSDNYKDMEKWYESSSDSPRFMFLLTFQNHGGYERNDSQYDTVSINENLGEYTDDVNEFLTSIHESAKAFSELIQYYSVCDRKVVIMMVGDHAPSFINNIPANGLATGLRNSIAKRTVPYFVWTNTEIDRSVFPEQLSMIDLVPLLLKSIGLPLSDYYQTIVNLNECMPIRTADGLGEDSSGNVFKITDSIESYHLYQQYEFMEYNNLRKEKDYMESIFMP